jgi:hypothetical protein
MVLYNEYDEAMREIANQKQTFLSAGRIGHMSNYSCQHDHRLPGEFSALPQLNK